MGTITDEVIDYVALLAKLSLDDDARQTARADLEQMLQYIGKLGTLDTEGVEPMTQVQAYPNVWRDDVVSGTGDHGVMDAAPVSSNHMYVVPKSV